jgi:hypothetical protein
MKTAVYIEDDNLFSGGPPIRLQKSLGLIKPGQHRVARRALFAALIAWAPLAALNGMQSLTSTSQASRSFVSDFAVHARYLVAVPALILAESDCLPRLGDIVRQFVSSGLVAGTDLPRYERAVSSTRRLLDSALGEVIAALLAYLLVIALIFYVSPNQLPDWYRGSGTTAGFSPAGWLHWVVSLPLLLILLFGWLWRLILWARFLSLMALLDLHLIPSHPDRTGGLKFVSSSLRRFRLISFAIGSISAGMVANRVVHQGAQPLGFKNIAIGLTIFIVIFSAGPLVIFLKKLRQTKKRGVFSYGGLAVRMGTEFEEMWLAQGAQVEKSALSAPDFSATTDLYSIVANAYEMRDVPFGLKDLFGPVAAGLAPFLPIALLAVPLQVVMDNLIKLLL